MADAVPLVPESTAGHAVCVLLKLGQVAFRLTDDTLFGHGLRVRHFSVMQALADRGALSQIEIGTHLRIDPATMVTTIDDLEQHGFAERRRHPTDRRRHIIDLTDKGRGLLPDLDDAITAIQDDFFADLTAAERTALTNTLAALNHSPALIGLYEKARGASA